MTVTMVSTEGLTSRSSCRAALETLGAYVRADLATGAAHRVSAHLECCRPCTAAYLELVEGRFHGRSTTRARVGPRV
jgi:anti-sigma factor RsiW